MEIGTVRLVNIDSEVRSSYLDYSMSVIVQRALPDVRDGMKPVQRRVLYAMHEMGMRRSSRHRKSAGIVGEVLKSYHPHGEAPVYDALVRMAQSWSLRYPLVDGQGNFGSVDGDPAAAMRYCVTGDTLVVTERGLERVDQLSADGDEEIATRVLSIDGQINTASKWFDCGPFPTRRVTTRRGYEVTGTTNHPLLVCVQGAEKEPVFVWKTIAQIKPGDYLVLDRSAALWPQERVDLHPLHPDLPPASRATRHILPTELDEDLALLLGALTAEGTCRPQVIEFTNTTGDFADAFRTTWERTFPTCRLHTFLREPTSYGRRPFWQMQIVSQQVIAFLNSLGLCGKPADRAIPEAILRSPQSVAAAFLRGLFEGDGAVERSGRSLLRISLCAKNRSLLRQVQTLLLRFGIASTLSAEKARGTYRLLIVGREGLQHFAGAIGFVSEVKQTALADALALHTGKALSRTDLVPFIAEYVREYASRGHREWVAKHNLDRPVRLAAALPRLAEALPAAALATVTRLHESRYLYEMVTSVEDAGSQRVYSIRVDSPCHSFVANGFVNHNTEARMAEITEELLRDIEKNTVDFVPNYDDTMTQPSVLPARLPALLLNGAAGIAVGMATNIPPHNLGELCDAIAYVIDNPEAGVEQLLEFIPGPDFPTGGIILGREGIKQAYATGKGRVIVRAKAYIEEAARGNRFQIIVTELPYQVNKATLVEKIAALVKDGAIDGISDLRDESDRNGMRIVVELKRESQPRKVLNQLFKHTAMQSTFGVNMLALVDGKQPRVLTLKRAIQHFIEHRQDVIRRRTVFELERARHRAHILEGLRIALDHLDQVIATIRNSRTTESARGNLMKSFSLTEVQANAILDLRLARLAQLERKKIDDEYKEVQKQIRALEQLLGDPARILGVIKSDLHELKEKYGDARRTVIKEGDGEIADEDLIPEIEVLLTLTNKGYVKRLPHDTYRTQHRGGRGVSGLTMREADDVQHIVSCNTMDSLLFFTNQGRVYHLKAHEVPEASRTAKGTAIINLLALQAGEVVTMPMAVRDFSNARYLVLATRRGKIKRTPLSQFAQVRSNGLIALTLEKDDELAWVRMSRGHQDIIIVTAQGKSIRFDEDNARPMGRPAAGVTGIKLATGDAVVGMDIVEPGHDLVFVSANGFGKRTSIDDYPRQGRGGSGVIAMRVTDKTGLLVGARMVTGEDNLMMITSKGIVIRIMGAQISRIGRATQGVTLMKVNAGERVVSMTLIDSTQTNGNNGAGDLDLLEVVAQA